MKKSLYMRLTAVICCVLIIAGGSEIKKGLRNVKNRAIKNSILTACAVYNVSKTKDSVVYYSEKDKQYVKVIERLINTYFPLLKNDMNANFNERAVVIIFPDEKDMYTLIGRPHTGATATGAYTAGIIAVLSPSEWLKNRDMLAVDDFIKNGPILHELSHFVLDKKANGNYKQWFSEGTALYYENKYTGFIWNSGTKTGTVTFKELTDNFKYINEQESYRKSYEIIKFIAEIDGEATLKRILDGLEKNKSLSNLVIDALMPESMKMLDNL